jgi:hypothetical protein
MEGKVPWVQKGKGKRDVTASANESKATESPAVNPPASQTAASAVATTSANHRQNLSFAVIEEIGQDYSHLALCSTSMILDSGTTSTLIMDREIFWTYMEGTSVKVKTANHGFLSTSGHGDCLADLTLNGRTFRIKLTDCLHAPSAYINLLSVSRMLKKGWSYNFQPYPPRCELSHRRELYGQIPEVNDLLSVELRFIRPGDLLLRSRHSHMFL